ncbi:Biotin carboxylase [Richelia intracellularis HH01]|uniref:Biotin carboxylase n=2 Tax=Richelia TaxID=98443 RepID=M1WZ43_9NOST|nr:Biotin carboxylase [Richelia intracellularis HH01]
MSNFPDSYTVSSPYLYMHLSLISVVFISLLINAIYLVFTPDAIALTQIKLFEVSYHECTPEIAKGLVNSNSRNILPANCFIVTGKAENTTNQTVYDADIFGRVYDANNDPVMQNRNRLGSIPEVSPGINDFNLRISVPTNQPTPLKLKKFKAVGFSSSVRPEKLYLNLESQH